MKTLMLILALSLCAAAQTSSNVTGLTLSGPPTNPTIENHSGKILLWVNWKRTHPVGGPSIANKWFIEQAGGLADGDSAKALNRPSKAETTSATIIAAIFGDGEFRGEDTGPIHNGFEPNFWLMNEAWRLAQAKEWDKLQVMADKVDDGILPQMAARKLLQARGNDAAMAALAYYGLLPANTWIGGQR